MITTQRRFHRSLVQLTIAAVAAGSFGSALVAAPFFAPKSVIARTEVAALQPLAAGPAIQLARAAPGEAEDCVRVTRMVGPDGKEYPTFGVVCGGK